MYVGCEVYLYNLKICVNVIMKLRCVSLCVGCICMCMRRGEEVSVYVQRGTHCATAFSMQSCVESAYQPYADGYH